MPIKIHFSIENNLIVSIHEGVVEDSELLASYKSLFENELFNINMNLLIDLSRTDSRVRGNEVLNSLAIFLSSVYQDENKSPKVAVLAPTDISFGLARAFGGMSNNIPINFSVFRTLESALTWLGVEGDPFSH